MHSKSGHILAVLQLLLKTKLISIPGVLQTNLWFIMVFLEEWCLLGCYAVWLL
jgi:hypothetical protein